MPGTSLTESPLRELAGRVSGGAEITLFWNERTGAVTVSVRNRIPAGTWSSPPNLPRRWRPSTTRTPMPRL